jgi:nucleoside-diphosphate-sugar epimerase
MTSPIATVLAVGAAGKFAGVVVPALAKQGVKVRGLGKDAKQGDNVRKLGTTEMAIGNLRERASALDLRTILRREPRILHAFFKELRVTSGQPKMSQAELSPLDLRHERFRMDDSVPLGEVK